MNDDPEARPQPHYETTPSTEHRGFDYSSRVELLNAPKKKTPHKGKRRGRKARRLTYDTDEEANGAVDAHSARELLEVRINSTEGTWVQCCHTECQKWRYLADALDPTEVPEIWYCSMNNDTAYNSCDIPEQDTSQLEFVEAKFYVGSIVWAKLGGYPWWPAMVDDDPDSLLFYCNEDPHDESRVSHYHVVFLDTQVSRAWIKSEKIVPYQQGITLRMIRKNQVPRYYARAYQTAKKNAELSLMLPLAARIKKFCFLTRYRKKPETKVVPQKKPRGRPRKQTNDQAGDNHSSSTQSETGGHTFRELSKAQNRGTKRGRGQSKKEASSEPSPRRTFSAINTLRKKQAALNNKADIDNTLEETVQDQPKSGPKKRGRKRKDEGNDKPTSSKPKKLDRPKKLCKKSQDRSKEQAVRSSKADGNNRSIANESTESATSADNPNVKAFKSDAVSAVRTSGESRQQAAQQACKVNVPSQTDSTIPSSTSSGHLTSSQSQDVCIEGATTQSWPSTHQSPHVEIMTQSKMTSGYQPSTDAITSADRTCTNHQAGTTPCASSTQLVPPSDVTPQQTSQCTALTLKTRKSEVIMPLPATVKVGPDVPPKVRTSTQPKESDRKITAGLQLDSNPFSTLSADTPLPHIDIPSFDSESDPSRPFCPKHFKNTTASPLGPQEPKMPQPGTGQSGLLTFEPTQSIPAKASPKDPTAVQLPFEAPRGAEKSKLKRTAKDTRVVPAKAQSVQKSTSHENEMQSPSATARVLKAPTKNIPKVPKWEAKASTVTGSNSSTSVPPTKHSFRVPNKTDAKMKDGAGAKIVPLFTKQKSVSVGTKVMKPKVDSSPAPSSSAPDDSDFESLSNSSELTFHPSPSLPTLDADDFFCLEKLCTSQAFDSHEE